MQLVPKRQIGGNLYKIDNTMPQITQRYVALLNKGIPAQADFEMDTILYICKQIVNNYQK